MSRHPDVNAIVVLELDDDGPFELHELTPGEAVAPGALVARDSRGPKEIRYRAAEVRYNAAVRRRDGLAYDDPRRREAEAEVRHAGRMLRAENTLSRAYLDFVRDQDAPVPHHLEHRLKHRRP